MAVLQGIARRPRGVSNASRQRDPYGFVAAAQKAGQAAPQYGYLEQPDDAPARAAGSGRRMTLDGRMLGVTAGDIRSAIRGNREGTRRSFIGVVRPETQPPRNPMSFAQWKAMQGYQPGDVAGTESPDPYVPAAGDEYGSTWNMANLSMGRGGIPVPPQQQPTAQAMVAAAPGFRVVPGTSGRIVPDTTQGPPAAPAFPPVMNMPLRFTPPIRQNAAMLPELPETEAREEYRDARNARQDAVRLRGIMKGLARQQRLQARRMGGQGQGGGMNPVMRQLAARDPAAFARLMMLDQQNRMQAQQFDARMGLQREQLQDARSRAQAADQLARDQMEQQGNQFTAGQALQALLGLMRNQGNMSQQQMSALATAAQLPPGPIRDQLLDMATRGGGGGQQQPPRSDIPSPDEAAAAAQAAGPLRTMAPADLIAQANILDQLGDNPNPRDFAAQGYTQDVLEDIVDYQPWFPPSSVGVGGPHAWPIWKLFGESTADAKRRYRRQENAQTLLDLMNAQ